MALALQSVTETRVSSGSSNRRFDRLTYGNGAAHLFMDPSSFAQPWLRLVQVGRERVGRPAACSLAGAVQPSSAGIKRTVSANARSPSRTLEQAECETTGCRRTQRRC